MQNAMVWGIAAGGKGVNCMKNGIKCLKILSFGFKIAHIPSLSAVSTLELIQILF